MAATPLKCFVVYQLQLWVVDYSNAAELVAIAGSQEQLDWLVGTLEAFHKRPAIRSESPVWSRMPELPRDV